MASTEVTASLPPLVCQPDIRIGDRTLLESLQPIRRNFAIRLWYVRADSQIATLCAIGNSHSVINFEGIVHLLHREVVAYTNILPRHRDAAGNRRRDCGQDPTEEIKTTRPPYRAPAFLDKRDRR
jgi:hypothetical protein